MMSRLITRGLILLVVAMLSSVVSAGPETGRVDGVVRYRGMPLAGVEVFLGIQSDPFVPLYTCTDANGQFAFTGLPVDTTFIAAAGIEVNFDERCSNALLVDTSNRRLRQPLLTQTWNGNNGYGVQNPFGFSGAPYVQSLTFDLIAWPTDGDNLLNGFIRSGTYYFQQGRTPLAISTFQAFKNIVRLYRVRRLVTAEIAAALTDYADDYIALFTELGG